MNKKITKNKALENHLSIDEINNLKESKLLKKIHNAMKDYGNWKVTEYKTK